MAVALAVAGAAPDVAPALNEFVHDDAEDCRDCHVGGGKDLTNAACTGCHSGFRAAPGDTCWDCHRPGADTEGWRTSNACAGTCHLWDPQQKGYETPFAHGAVPHDGADYQSCLTCHHLTRTDDDPGLSEHHDAVDSPAPTCRDCHAKALHDGLTDCEACHSGMDRPALPATCNACHAPASFGSGSCTAAACHGSAVMHDPTPGLGKSCADCHTPHYQSLGTCATCHPDAPAYHHTGAETPPLADCSACHDGTIAAAQTTHDSVAGCSSCHSGMDTPSVPASCNRCHTAASFGSGACTAAACHGEAAIHSADPGLGKSCADCHTPHYAGLGTCTDCHPDVPAYHHLGTQATPLADCAACHDGTIAAARSLHDGLTSCSACHSGMDTPTQPPVCLGCHASPAHPEASQIAYTNDLACADARCHGSAVAHDPTPGLGKTCADCHTPHYQSLGTCTDCHPDVPAYHHLGTQATPLADCAACHDGTIAAVPVGHEGRGSDCAACHIGMTIPSSGDCVACHQHQQGPWPAVAYTNDLACTEAGCHGKVPMHVGTPIVDAPCATCHSAQSTGHYQDLGACASCHADLAGYHHGTSQAIALSACESCHDGTIAAARSLHDGLTACSDCHSGMDLPALPGSCNPCHSAGVFGTGSCTAVTCHTDGAIHSAAPDLGKTCSDCHRVHFEEMATCETCHPDYKRYHHRTGVPDPGAACGRCHPEERHDGIETCAACHKGADLPPVPATCHRCHSETAVGARSCTDSSCHDDSGVHDATPGMAKTCVDCHASHYGDAGGCGSCHGMSPDRHHGLLTEAPATLALSLSATEVRFGAAVTVAGTLRASGRGVPNATVTIQAREAGRQAFTTVASLVSDAAGGFSTTFSPGASGAVRVVFNGQVSETSVIGPAVTETQVGVRPVVKLAIILRSGATTSRVRATHGARVTFRGSVLPVLAARGEVRLVLKRARASASGTTWTTVRTVTRPVSDSGRYSWRWLTRKPGSYRLTAVVTSSTGFVRGESRVVRIRVL